MSGVLPIPWSSVDRYARRHRIDGEDFETLLRMIRAADEEFLKLHNKEKPKSE